MTPRSAVPCRFITKVAAEGWRAYTGPNPHTDHIHIGVNRDGASKRTSFWR